MVLNITRMKSIEMLEKWPMRFTAWNLNEETGVFWAELSALEEQGLFDPWGQRFALRGAKRKINSVGDTTEFQLYTEFQGYPAALVVLNE